MWPLAKGACPHCGLLCFMALVKEQPYTSASTDCSKRSTHIEPGNWVCLQAFASLASPEGQCQSTESKDASSSALSQASSGPGTGQGRVDQQDACPLLISCSVPSTAVLKPQSGCCLVSFTPVMLLVNSGPMLLTPEKSNGMKLEKKPHKTKRYVIVSALGF